MDSSAEWLAESGVTVGLCRLERHSSTSACGSQDTSRSHSNSLQTDDVSNLQLQVGLSGVALLRTGQGWFADPSSYSEEEADFLNEVLLHQVG